MLEPRQFGEMAAALKEPDGGYSISVRTGKEPPGPGYMVSQASRGRSFPAGHDVSPGEIEAHTEEHSEELNKPGRYAGGWHDPATHQKDLDVSQRYTSHPRAVNAMWANDQTALYDTHEWRSERNWMGRGAPEEGPGSTLQYYMPKGTPAMSPEGYRRLQKTARRRAR